MRVVEKQEKLLNEAVKVGRLVFGEIKRIPINATVWPSVEKGKNLLTFQYNDGFEGGWFRVHIPVKHKKLIESIKKNTAKLRETYSSAWLILSCPKEKGEN